jgi:hypothetical protein
MPDFGLKLHHWGPEWIIGRDLDIDVVCAALIRSVWWSWEGPAEVCDVFLAANGIDLDLGILVFMDVGNLFANPAHAVASHFDLTFALKRYR